MARINIEPKLFADERFIKFIALVGCHYKAIGMWVFATQAAQKYWAPKQLPIPHKVFKQLGGSKQLVESGLVTRMRAGFYLAGSRDSFRWLVTLCDLGAKGRESQRNKVGVRHAYAPPPTPTPNTAPEKKDESEGGVNGSSVALSSISKNPYASWKNTYTPTGLEAQKLLKELVDYWNLNPKLKATKVADLPIGRKKSECLDALIEKPDPAFWKRAVDGASKAKWFSKGRYNLAYLITSGNAQDLSEVRGCQFPRAPEEELEA